MGRNRLSIDYNLLYDLYVNKKLSVVAIGKIFKCSQGTISKHLKYVGIKSRPFHEKGRTPWNKNKQNIYSNETLLKMSNSQKGRIVSEKTRLKISKALYGIKRSEETKLKMSKNNINYWKDKSFSKEHKEKISKSLKGRVGPMYGKSFTDIHKEKLRKTRFKYLKEIGQINGPNIGRAEKPMLDALEKCFGYEIERQKYINGYFIDGYCSALNLAIEIDEKHHIGEEQMKKDIYREQQIKNELQCNFVRIDVGELQ